MIYLWLIMSVGLHHYTVYDMICHLAKRYNNWHHVLSCKGKSLSKCHLQKSQLWNPYYAWPLFALGINRACPIHRILYFPKQNQSTNIKIVHHVSNIIYYFRTWWDSIHNLSWFKPVTVEIITESVDGPAPIPPCNYQGIWYKIICNCTKINTIKFKCQSNKNRIWRMACGHQCNWWAIVYAAYAMWQDVRNYRQLIVCLTVCCVF